MPPFPATMPSQRIDNQVRVENLLRNYISVNKQELNRLKGDLTAYRQEAQTAFKQNVAYPRPTVQLGDLPSEAPSETDVGPTGGGEISEPDIGELSEALAGMRIKKLEGMAGLPPRRRERKTKTMAELKRELRAEDVPYPSNIKKDALHALAKQYGISLER